MNKDLVGYLQAWRDKDHADAIEIIQLLKDIHRLQCEMRAAGMRINGTGYEEAEEANRE